jgi:hypothetical protein
MSTYTELGERLKHEVIVAMESFEGEVILRQLYVFFGCGDDKGKEAIIDQAVAALCAEGRMIRDGATYVLAHADPVTSVIVAPPTEPRPRQAAAPRLMPRKSGRTSLSEARRRFACYVREAGGRLAWNALYERATADGITFKGATMRHILRQMVKDGELRREPDDTFFLGEQSETPVTVTDAT